MLQLRLHSSIPASHKRQGLGKVGSCSNEMVLEAIWWRVLVYSGIMIDPDRGDLAESASSMTVQERVLLCFRQQCANILFKERSIVPCHEEVLQNGPTTA